MSDTINKLKEQYDVYSKELRTYWAQCTRHNTNCDHIKCVKI